MYVHVFGEKCGANERRKDKRLYYDIWRHAPGAFSLLTWVRQYDVARRVITPLDLRVVLELLEESGWSPAQFAFNFAQPPPCISPK